MSKQEISVEFETPSDELLPAPTISRLVELGLVEAEHGRAVQSTLDAGGGYSTIENKVNLTRAITRESGLLRAEAKVVHLGSRVATAEGRVTDEAGKIVAHGTSTCLIIRKA